MCRYCRSRDTEVSYRSRKRRIRLFSPEKFQQDTLFSISAVQNEITSAINRFGHLRTFFVTVASKHRFRRGAKVGLLTTSQHFRIFQATATMPKPRWPFGCSIAASLLAFSSLTVVHSFHWIKLHSLPERLMGMR